MAVVIATLAIFGLRRGRGRRARGGGARCFAALDDLVEFAAVEPDAAALRALVDLDALAFAHYQRDAAGRAEKTGVRGIHVDLQTSG